MNRSLLLAAALGLFAAAQAHDAPAVTFVAGDRGLRGPAYAEAGYVRLVLDNRDDAMRAHGIFRVEDGASLRDAQALTVRVFAGEEVSREEEEALTDGFYGGAVFIPPGAAGEVGVTLEPGRYVVYADEITEQGVAVTPAYVTTLAVTPSEHRALPPTPDYTVTMVDHAFAFPANVAAGAHLFRVENAGRQEHMMFVSKLLPGKTSEDVAALLEDENSDPTTVMEEETFGVHALRPGLFNDVVFDLEPGEYAAVCFATDPETGTPHAVLGMTQTFTVVAAGGR